MKSLLAVKGSAFSTVVEVMFNGLKEDLKELMKDVSDLKGSLEFSQKDISEIEEMLAVVSEKISSQDQILYTIHKESCQKCIPGPIMASTNLSSAHWHEVLFLALDYSHAATTTGRVGGACLPFVSRYKDQFTFCAQRPMMIATFTLCFQRAFSDVLEGITFKAFS